MLKIEDLKGDWKNAINQVICADSLDVMRLIPDGAIDLTLSDPPYGIDFSKFNRTNKTAWGKRYKANKYHGGDWDSEIPPREFFEEMLRVSKDQIIWGGNYFPCLWENGCKGFIFWHKKQPVNNFSKGELAWTSFNRPANFFEFAYYGGIEGRTKAVKKEHPTQKPLELMRWCLENYAKDCRTVIDPFGGSGTTARACKDMGKDFIIIDKEPKYCEIMEKRLEQLNLF